MRELGTRLECCFCGEDTADAEDYVEIRVVGERSKAQQYFAAHAEHLNAALARGFEAEVHLMTDE